MLNNIDYYNNHAEEFYNNTVDADMSTWRNKFGLYVRAVGKGCDSCSGQREKACGRILDAGCGSGRDSLAFLKQGFAVEAFDASDKMCELASNLIGQQVKNITFDQVDYHQKFQGIWACASLLHVPMDELPEVLNKLREALVCEGIIYASFKYGEGEMTRGERSFTNFTQVTAMDLFEHAGFLIVEGGITTDVRPGRDEERWINIIARKK